MVFETVVADLINRYLGDFIENLDRSQLKLGLWGGDVVLKDLLIKESALDDLDLPVKVCYGNLGKLTLHIPWKNLYTEPTVATLEGLYMIAVPNLGIKYDAEKESKTEWDSKQSQLTRIMEQEKNRKMAADVTAGPDSFVEKLAANVIKNLQVHITDIHMRYEDAFTNPSQPFSVGVTLKELRFQTTDENWQPTVIKEAVSIVFKSIKLNSLGLYWNSLSDMYVNLPKDQRQQTLQKNIASDSAHTEYQYLVHPISSGAQIQLCTKPQKHNYEIPKILLNVIFQEIALVLTRDQYSDVMELLESRERLTLGAKFRKYHPQVDLLKDRRRWWHFAYESVLGETVRPRRNMWSWENMKRHREVCREYKEAYRQKQLAGSKIPAPLQEKLQKCEKELNVFNIMLMRRQADLLVREDQKHKQGFVSSWFGGWFRGSSTQEESGVDVKELMTPEEKAKLYTAIGYDEEDVDPNLPKQFEAVKVNAALKHFTVCLKDRRIPDCQCILQLHLNNLSADFKQRPSANAISVVSTIDSMMMSGLPHPEVNRDTVLLSSLDTGRDQCRHLLSVKFETNPLDSDFNQMVNVSAQPLEIVYDASTVNQLAEFFKPPEWVHLKQLRNTAMSRFEELKEQTATGLRHAVETRTYADIKVNFQPSYIILPQDGVYQSNCNRMVMDLGEFKIDSVKQERLSALPSPTEVDSDHQLNYEEIQKKAYDIFEVSLQRLQLLYVKAGEDWKSVRGSHTPMHVLKPVKLDVTLHKCMIQDKNLPSLKVQGVLPSLVVPVSDKRLQDILGLVKSIPFPESQPAVEEEDDTDLVETDENLLGKTVIKTGDTPMRSLSTSSSTSSMDFANHTNIDVSFEIKEICLSMAQYKEGREIPILKLVIDSLGTRLQMRTFDMYATVYLGGIFLQYTEFKELNNGPLINLINTPVVDANNTAKLLTVEFIKTDRKSPVFVSDYNNTEQKLTVHFTALEVLLHQQAMCSLLQFALTLQDALAPTPTTPKPPPVVAASAMAQTATAAFTAKKNLVKRAAEKMKASKSKRVVIEVIDIAVDAALDVFIIGICTQDKVLADIKIKGLTANVTMQKSKMCVLAALQGITVYDPTPNALYPEILACEGDMLKSTVNIYNNATKGDNFNNMEYVDMHVELQMGCLKVIFLNKFVSDLANFAAQFQAAQAAMVEAGSAMAESATAAAQQAQQSSSRIRLNIKIKAPVIIVPQSSTNNNAIVVDLGNIAIGNVFKVGSQKNNDGQVAVLDHMTVTLTQLKLSRALMLGTEMLAECLLLEPVSLELSVVRNLSIQWYHKSAGVEVAGKLDHFSITMSEGDLKTLMGMLNENLAEGQPAGQPETPKALPPATAAAVVEGERREVGQGKASVEPAASPTVYTNLKFDFTLHTIKTAIYQGDNQLTTGVCVRQSDHAIGGFELCKITASGAIMSDGCIAAQVTLDNCLMDDLRSGKEAGITRLMEASERQVEGHSMIAVKYSKDAKSNQDINVAIESIFLCVCPDFLLRVSKFFSSATTSSTPPAKPQPAPTAVTAPAPASPPTAAGMLISLEMKSPEIYLIENQNDTNTQALLVKLMLKFKMTTTPDVTSMMASVEGLQIQRCYFNTDERQTSAVSMVLNPMEVVWQSSALAGRGPHMEVMLTNDVVFNICPAVVRILMATLQTLPKAEEEESANKSALPDDLWEPRNVTDCDDFWFLKSAEELNADDQETEIVSLGEELIVTMKKLVIMLEADISQHTVPLLFTELGMQASIKDWSTKLFASCELWMEVAYCNENVAVWEPLLERVEDDNRHRPYEITVELVTNDPHQTVDEEDLSAPLLPQPVLTINVSSRDVLQLTLSKKGLDILTTLGKLFGDAASLTEQKEEGIEEAPPPLLVQNDIGVAVTITFDDSFEKPAAAVDGELTLETTDSVAIRDSEAHQKKLAAKSVIRTTQQDNMKLLQLKVDHVGVKKELRVIRAEKRAFAVSETGYPDNQWHFVCDTQAFYGHKTVTLRSILQVANHLPFDVELYYKLSDDAMGRCGSVSGSSSSNVPLAAIYNSPCQIYLKPTDSRYNVSNTGVDWKTLPENTNAVVCCSPGTAHEIPAMHFNAHVETELVAVETGTLKKLPVYVLHLHPCVVLRNLLPFPVTYTVEGIDESEKIEGGEKMTMWHIDVGTTTLRLKIMNYEGHDWEGSLKVKEKPETLAMCSFDPIAVEGKTPYTLELGVHSQDVGGYQEVSLYCPYWIINKSGRNLAYKSNDDTVVNHTADHGGIMLFSFKSGQLIGAKKACLKIGESDWSDKFSLDTVGSSGTVTCKVNGNRKQETRLKGGLLNTFSVVGLPQQSMPKAFQVGINISLSSSGLTKIVSISPYYLLFNHTEVELACMEVATDEKTSIPWITVGPGQCLPFWPVQSSQKAQMVVKVDGTDTECMPFSLSEPHNTLLQLRNEYGGLGVECVITETAIQVTFSQYSSGLATVQLVNHTMMATIDYSQVGSGDTKCHLEPGKTVLYTWDDPLKKRELVWSCDNEKDHKDKLVEDGNGDFFHTSDSKLYWVSFLNGMQRVLFFTEDIALAIIAQQAGELEQIDKEMNVSLQGLGLSLVDNDIAKEIAYISITSSGVIWEEKKRKRYRALKLKQSVVIEKAYELYQASLAANKNMKSRVHLEGKLEVDFGEEQMMMYKPHKCSIRRSFEDGIWLQYRASPHQLQLHTKIHRLQIDDQLPGAMFPVVFAPIPPPKSVAADSVPKPFTELSVMIRTRDYTNVKQFKYCKLLIQEMELKVDQGFINAMMAMFASSELTTEDERNQFNTDVESTRKALEDDMQQTSANEQKHFYDMLHFSPLKVHLSFSLYGTSGDEGQPKRLRQNVMDVFLQSVGIVLTDIQDVIFKLGYFERNHAFYNQTQLSGHITRHYIQQAVKQMYVLVLGLDVLGNPFGVIRGLATGIETLFYEPYQGAVQGPEEFAEGLALGVRSLLGHAVGGAAGAVSRITGALGKGIATLTLDDDYQKKRRDNMTKRPADVKEGLARGGKGLVMGVVDGVTGIVTKPMEGAKKEGVEGFFKGVGKGLVGVITRPASGVVDFASISFEGIRRAADVATEVRRQRPPRLLQADGVVKPYFFREADGMEILRFADKGKFAETDMYLAHVYVTDNHSNVLMVTDKRVMFASKGEIFGQWDSDWRYTWDELKEVPTVGQRGVQLLLKKKEKKLFKSSTMGKSVPIPDQSVAKWVVAKMKEAMEQAKYTGNDA